MKLLLIEDDTELHTALSRSLTRLGWQVEVCEDGLAMLQPARDEGLRTPVLNLTARGTVGDKVHGLNAGADDHLPKQFDLDELETRVRALLARAGQAVTKEGLFEQVFPGLTEVQFEAIEVVNRSAQGLVSGLDSTVHLPSVNNV